MAVQLERRIRIAASAVVLCALAAGGIAYATIPSASGVIYVCYKKNGEMRLIDVEAGETCGIGETLLSWNQAGSTGPTGPTGPRGPSTAFTNYGESVVIDPGNTVTIASVTLPVGRYTLLAKAENFALADRVDLTCRFLSAGTVHQSPGRLVTAPVDQNGTPIATLSVIGDVTISSDNTSVFLRCTSSDDDFASGRAFVFGGVIATQVETIIPSL